MGLPTLENGPYIFNVNNLVIGSNPTDKCRKTILALKDALVALGGAGVIWDVVASCDGTSVKNIGDASPDLWADSSDIVQNTEGNAHSWCVLEHQTSGEQILIDCRSESYNQFEMRHSFDGSYQTDGTTTASPTATNSYTMRQFNTNFSTTSTTQLRCVVNVMTSADNKTLRIYLHQRDSSSGETAGTYMAIEEIVNTPSVWTSARKLCVFYSNENINFSATTYYKSPRAELLDGSVWILRVDTAEPASLWVSMQNTSECYGNLDAESGATPLWQVNNSLGFNGGFPICPIGLYESAAGTYGGSWGRFRDIYWAQQLHDTLDTYPSDGSRLWVKWGCFLVPWNGTAPLDAE